MSALGARLHKLERTIRPPKNHGRVICIVTGERDQTEAEKLLEAEGYDPEKGDRAIFQIIVSPAGREPWSELPYVLQR